MISEIGWCASWSATAETTIGWTFQVHPMARRHCTTSQYLILFESDELIFVAVGLGAPYCEYINWSSQLVATGDNWCKLVQTGGNWSQLVAKKIVGVVIPKLSHELSMMIVAT